MKSKSNRAADCGCHDNRKELCEGLRDGIPIALGYLAVGFTLGIAARSAGLSSFQGFLASLLNNASAGEYAGFSMIAVSAGYWEIALITLITNARYMLMSASLSQKLAPETSLGHRMLIAFDVTDEIFGLSIIRKGFLNPYYTYGLILIAMPCWALGTGLGVIAGDILPADIVSALSVALYGMFIAIIIPPSRRNRAVLAAVAASFAASFIIRQLPFFRGLSNGNITIILTLLIGSIAAAAAPVPPVKKEARDA